MHAYSLNDLFKFFADPDREEDPDIEGSQYTSLMNWALDRSDVVMLVYELSPTNEAYNQELLSVRDSLSRHRIYTRSTPTKWPGTAVSFPSPAEIARIRKSIPNYNLPDPSLYIDFYAVTPEFRRYVLSAGHIRGWYPPSRPEDIAFFTKGKCWFFTTIHEHCYTICGLHPGTREQLESLGIPFDEYKISKDDLHTEPALIPHNKGGFPMLTNTVRCLTHEKKLTVAYFGGSITEGGGENGWRRLTTKWLETKYPDAKITEVNAAIGGTGTDLGAYRCNRDVISAMPDLTFIEFAVNDSGAAPADLARTTEAIVRKLLTANPFMDVVFVFTITKKIYDQLAAGIPYRSRDIHAAIAAHYGLPTIDIGTALAEASEQTENGWLEYTSDTVHPNTSGYAVKQPALLAGLAPLLCSSSDSLVKHPLPGPLYDRLPTGAQLVDARELIQSCHPGLTMDNAQPDTAPEQDWSRLLLHLCGRWPSTIGSNKPGSEFTFSFTGSNLGIYWMMASDSGDIDYRIDGGEWQHKSSFDEYCLRFARANFHMLAQDLPEGLHTVTVRVSNVRDDRSAGCWVRIGAFGIS